MDCIVLFIRIRARAFVRHIKWRMNRKLKTGLRTRMFTDQHTYIYYTIVDAQKHIYYSIRYALHIFVFVRGE